MNEAFLGLGGNMGDRLENIRKAVAAIEAECGSVSRVSHIYETEAWGSDSDKKYFNQVIKISTALTAEQLLKKMLAIEQTLGRVRSGSQNADRTVDIDLLFYNDAIIHLNNIQVPHPRLHLRKFVLVPLCEIEPELIHPGLKKSVQHLLAECEDRLEVIPVGHGN